MGSITDDTSPDTSLGSTCLLMCCLLLLKTALGRRQKLQMCPHHQMPRLAETAPVATFEESIVPGVIYLRCFADVLGIFLATASRCLAEFSTGSSRKKMNAN